MKSKETDTIKVRADLLFAVACAPKKATRAQVVAAAAQQQPGPRWHIVHGNRKTSDGARFPVPCLDDPGRVHWLLEC